MIHEDLSLPPEVANSEDLRGLELVTWVDKRDCKNRECCICLDQFEKGAAVRILPCMHGFHQVCIDTWLLSRQRRCPLCNQDILDAENHFRSSSAGRSVELATLNNQRKSSRYVVSDSAENEFSDLDMSDMIKAARIDGILAGNCRKATE